MRQRSRRSGREPGRVRGFSAATLGGTRWGRVRNLSTVRAQIDPVFTQPLHRVIHSLLMTLGTEPCILTRQPAPGTFSLIPGDVPLREWGLRGERDSRAGAAAGASRDSCRWAPKYCHGTFPQGGICCRMGVTDDRGRRSRNPRHRNADRGQNFPSRCVSRTRRRGCMWSGRARWGRAVELSPHCAQHRMVFPQSLHRVIPRL